MTVERYRKDIERLAHQGHKLFFAILFEVDPSQKKELKKEELDKLKLPRFREEYQAWYSEALAVVAQLLPHRVDDFVACYKPLKPRKTLDASTYTILDYLNGITASRGASTIVGFNAALSPMQQQKNIVDALKKRFESTLYDIKTIAQADLLGDELDSATELNKKGFARGGGAIAGVVLESHLRTVCERHQVKVSKGATLGRLNDALKEADVIDVPTWRFNQHLIDLRNLCDHKLATEPTRPQVDELIAGVRKVTKTVL